MLGKITDGEVTDLQPIFFQLTFDTTLFMMFGETASKLQYGENNVRHRQFMNAFNVAQEYLAYRTRVGDLYWLINGPSMWKACRTAHSYVDDAIKQALDAGDQRKDANRRYVFIDALIERTRDPTVLRDQCLSLLLAGRDSTACLLTWTM